MPKHIYPAWIKCGLCDEFWCTIHDMHVADCPCRPIEDLTFDPYVEGGRSPQRRRGKRKRC